MADTRTVVLVLSPRASEVLDVRLTKLRAAIAVDDPDAVILDAVLVELAGQRADLPPLTAAAVAEAMANAGAKAVTEAVAL